MHYERGTDANNTFNGVPGASTMMVGGKGDDTYFVDNLDDLIVEKSSEGNDIVRFTYQGNSQTSGVTGMYTLTSNVEHAILQNTSQYNLAGNSLGNELVGNNANNVIYGYAGGDRLSGRGGIDTLIGGQGGDIYEISSTTQEDIIDDQGGTGDDYVSFSNVINEADVAYAKIGSDLVLTFGTNKVTVQIILLS